MVQIPGELGNFLKVTCAKCQLAINVNLEKKNSNDRFEISIFLLFEGKTSPGR